MFNTFEIKKYTGETGVGTADVSQNPEYLHKPGLNAICAVLSYGLHMGLVTVAEEDVCEAINNPFTRLFVTRNVDSRVTDGAGLIVACASVYHIRAFRSSSLRVTDFAIHSGPGDSTVICSSLLRHLAGLGQALEVDCLVMETVVTDEHTRLYESLGFKSLKNMREFNWKRALVATQNRRIMRSGISLGEFEERIEELLG